MADEENEIEQQVEDGAPAEEPKESEEQKSKKKMLRLFILLAIVNGLFLSWLIYTMQVDVEAPRPDEVESLAQEIPEEVTEETEEEGVESLYDSIAIEPFLVNVVARHKERSRQGQKVLRVRFEVIPEGEEVAAILEKKMPKIRDSVNILLSSQDYGDLAMSHGREALRNLIKDQINEVIQPARIKKVYFTEFVIN